MLIKLDCVDLERPNSMVQYEFCTKTHQVMLNGVRQSFEECKKAVSYTHLDVYKRQSIKCGSALTERRNSSMTAMTGNFLLNLSLIHI